MTGRHLPYIIIVLITAVMTLMRYVLLPSWSVKDHFVSAFIQLLSSILLWIILKGWNQFLNKRMPFKRYVFKRLVVQTIVAFASTLPMLFLVEYFVTPLFPPLPFMGREFKVLVVALFFIVIVLINFSFYGFYFFKAWQTSVRESAELKIYTATVEMQQSKMHFHNLKNQVNPHFLFNTLTSLDGLIQTNAGLASEFVHHLAKVYRYVLEHRENEIVSLHQEVDFIKHYLLLLEIRFKEALDIRLNITDNALDKNIVMITLQMLIDNAIKHNTLQDKKPLQIVISDKDDYLHVGNNKQLRKQIETSTKQGLKQLKELYAYLSPKPLIIDETDQRFEVRMPLL